MRKVMALALAFLLAACGLGGEEFTVDVKQSPDKVYGALLGLNGGELPRVLALPPVTKTRPEEGQIRLSLRGDDGKREGHVLLSINGNGSGGSTISVAMDLPSVITKVNGVDKQLSETLAASLFKQKLKMWAAKRSKGEDSSSEFATLNEVVGALVLAMSPDKMKDTFAMAQGGSAMESFLEAQETQASWDSDSDMAQFEEDRNSASDEESGSDDGWGSEKDAPEGFGKPTDSEWAQSNEEEVASSEE